MQLDTASVQYTYKIEERTRLNQSSNRNSSTSSGASPRELAANAREIERYATIKKNLEEKTHWEQCVMLANDIYNSRFLSSQLDLDNIRNIDYIKKLVFSICSFIPMYKGTQEMILSGKPFDMISVLIDFYNH